MFAHVPLIFRYGVAGLTGASIQIATDYLFVDVWGIWYMYAVVVGFLIALLVTFLLQKYWTFKDFDHEKISAQLRWYSVIAVGSFVANVALMRLFVDGWGYWYLPAHIVTIGLVTGVSFLCNNILTFYESGVFRKKI